MQVSLTDDLQRFVEEQVRSGRYATAEDVLRAALAALRQLESLDRWTNDELEAAFPGTRSKIEEGLRSLRSGHVIDGESFFDELDREDEAAAHRKTA